MDYDSGFFNLGRDPPFPAIYPAIKHPVTVDVLETGWIVAFFTAYFCFLLLLPATVGKEKAIYFLRVSVTLFVGLVIMLCNFGQEWEIGEVKSKMFYKAGSASEINGTVTLKLGLRSVNITLNADSSMIEDLNGEIINYNERFNWGWDQGRAGFGPFAGEIQREFREAQLKGVPYPILWVAEYFTFDGEGLRFGRHYRYAGWYAHICIWSALPAWILTVCLFKLVIKYGAIMLTILGSLLMTASFIWCSVRNYTELAIVFNDHETGILKTHYGIHWYLSLIVGIACFAFGVLIYFADDFFHDGLSKFFGVNPYGIIDENYGDDVIEMMKDPSNQMEMQETTATSGSKKTPKKTIVYKARGTTKVWQKSSLISKRKKQVLQPLPPSRNVQPGVMDGNYAYQNTAQDDSYTDVQSNWPNQGPRDQIPHASDQYQGQQQQYKPQQNQIVEEMYDPYYYEDVNFAGSYDYSDYYTDAASQDDWQYINPMQEYEEDQQYPAATEGNQPI